MWNVCALDSTNPCTPPPGSIKANILEYFRGWCINTSHFSARTNLHLKACLCPDGNALAGNRGSTAGVPKMQLRKVTSTSTPDKSNDDFQLIFLLRRFLFVTTATNERTSQALHEFPMCVATQLCSKRTAKWGVKLKLAATEPPIVRFPSFRDPRYQVNRRKTL